MAKKKSIDHLALDAAAAKAAGSGEENRTRSSREEKQSGRQNRISPKNNKETECRYDLQGTKITKCQKQKRVKF